jgi:hypothetical protein
LDENAGSFKDFLWSVLSGTVPTPFGNFRCLPHPGNSISTFFTEQPRGLGSDSFQDKRLEANGARHSQFINSHMLPLELRSADKPYESIQELAAELKLNAAQGDGASVTVTASHVAELDEVRRVTGERADIGVFLSARLDRNLVSVGYKVLVKGQVVQRSRIGGEAFSWSERDHRSHGTHTLAVPPGALLQCFVSYDGLAQHHGWIRDPDTFPNPRWVAHNAFDPDLQVLRNYIFEEKTQRAQSRDFEVGVANLLFLLGFSVDPLVGKPLEEGPDLLATSRSGDVLVIECTTSVINKDGKLGKLVDRAESIRSRLKASSITDLRVLPVMVTCRPTDAIADKEQAKKLGVVVVALEDLESAIDRTVVMQDSDLLFNQAWDSVRRRTATEEFVQNLLSQ